jgi:hypothetical protein
MVCRDGGYPKLSIKDVLDMRGSIKLVTSNKEFHMEKLERKEFEIEISNHSNSNWLTGSCNPVNISYHWFNQIEIFDGERTPLCSKVLNAG